MKNRWIKEGVCLSVLMLAIGPLMAQTHLADYQSRWQTREPIEQVTLSSAVRRAIEWHPSIQGANERLKQQSEEINYARAAYYPQLSLGLNTDYRDSTRKNNETFKLTASQLLYDFGKTRSQVKLAEYGEEKFQADSLRVADQLIRDTAFAVIEVERYQVLFELAGKEVASMDDILALAKQRVSKGASSRSDLTQTASRREAAVATRLHVQAQLKTWQQQLQIMIGSTVVPHVIASQDDVLSQACAVNLDDSDSLQNIPEVMVASAQRNEALTHLEASAASYYPTISLKAGAEYDVDGRRFDGRELNNQKDDYTIGIDVSVDLYQGGAKSARNRAARHALIAAETARDEAVLRMTQGLLAAQSQVLAYESRVSILDTRIDSIIETQALYRRQYLDLGTRSLLDLLNTEQEIYQAVKEQDNTRQDLKRLKVECLYNTAKLRQTFALNSMAAEGWHE